MKKISTYYMLLSIVLCLIGCDNNISQEDNAIATPQARIDTLTYLDLLENTDPLLSIIDIKNCNEYDAQSNPLVYTREWDDNTYVDLLDKYDIKFHNEFNMDSYARNRSVKMRHDVVMSVDDNDIDTTASSVEVTITNNVTPLTIVRPYVEECAIIPYCYYEDMEIEWNEDSNNSQGLAIIIRWTGMIINSETENAPIYHMCIVEDNGVTTLDNAMFENIPDRAYVTMFLIRANVLQVRNAAGLVNISDYDWEAILESYPEVGCQTTTVAMGTAAKLSFILVRDM